MSKFIYSSRCRRFMLEEAKRNKVHKFTRVSKHSIVILNEIVRNAMIGHVKNMPSKGKTL